MGGVFSFLSSFGKEKLGQVGQAITQRIVAWDPESATQAEIEEMIKELDKITLEAGKARAAFDKEKAEADAAKRNYDRYVAAAELLNKQHEEASATGDANKGTELATSLDKLLNELESLRPEAEREATEADEAKAYYEELKGLAEMAAEKVRTARQQLDKAKRDMQRAQVDQERAKARSEKAERMAGLRKDTSSLGVALAAMNKQAEGAKAAAEASELKTRLLTPVKAEEDSNIEAALKQVAGGPEVPATQSFADRLAALRKK